jgi:hypothetical protein
VHCTTTTRIVKELVTLSKGKMGLVLLMASIMMGFGTFYASGLLTASRTIKTSGSVKAINVGVYWDQQCTSPVSAIDWGTASPGGTVTETVYVKNGGNAPMTLSMSYGNWSPSSAGTYLALSWNREGAVLNAGGVVAAYITLTVSGSISGITAYSFDTVITGTG